MSAFVHRDRADKITVEDSDGHRLDMITKGRELELRTTDPCPHLTMQMAHELADELHQWAYAQQTVRSRRGPRTP